MVKLVTKEAAEAPSEYTVIIKNVSTKKIAGNMKISDGSEKI